MDAQTSSKRHALNGCNPSCFLALSQHHASSLTTKTSVIIMYSVEREGQFNTLSSLFCGTGVYDRQPIVPNGQSVQAAVDIDRGLQIRIAINSAELRAAASLRAAAFSNDTVNRSDFALQVTLTLPPQSCLFRCVLCARMKSH